MAAVEMAAMAAEDKHFSLTHIVYSPTDPLGLPLALLSVSPIFLFVAYFALVIFTRRLTLALLAIGSVCNEVLSLLLKRALRHPRPYPGALHVGHGYGMPSSHAQASAFLLAWGLGYSLSLDSRYPTKEFGSAQAVMRRVRIGIYVLGLWLWSLAVAYSRYALRYHSIPQVAAGYAVGFVAGTMWFIYTDMFPRRFPNGRSAKLRRGIEWVWSGLGGIGGWDVGGAEGGWLEGHFFVDDERKTH